MTLKCRVGWHNWSAWSEPYEETWFRLDKITKVRIANTEFTKTFQKRRCQDCRELERSQIS